MAAQKSTRKIDMAILVILIIIAGIVIYGELLRPTANISNYQTIVNQSYSPGGNNYVLVYGDIHPDPAPKNHYCSIVFLEEDNNQPFFATLQVNWYSIAIPASKSYKIFVYTLYADGTMHVQHSYPSPLNVGNTSVYYKIYV